MISQEVFRWMAKSTDLLGTAIHNIQAVWMGPDELQQANYALRSLAKCLQFLLVVPLSESLKVMWLVGIHNLDTLHHFSGLTHCLWHGKEGQNEGTVINHLQMVHYRLGLVCNKCNDCPSTSSDTLCCHGRQNCQHSGEGNPWQIGFIRVVTSRRQAKSIHLSWGSKQRSPGEMVSLGLPCWGHPHPLAEPWSRTDGEGNTCQPAHPVTCFPAHLDQVAARYSWITQDMLKVQTWQQ